MNAELKTQLNDLIIKSINVNSVYPDIFCVCYENGIRLTTLDIFAYFDRLYCENIDNIKISVIKEMYKNIIDNKNIYIDVEKFNSDIYEELISHVNTNYTNGSTEDSKYYSINKFYVDIIFDRRVWHDNEIYFPDSAYHWLIAKNIKYDENIFDIKNNSPETLDYKFLLTDVFEMYFADEIYFDKLVKNMNIYVSLAYMLADHNLFSYKYISENTDNNKNNREYIISIFQKYYYKIISYYMIKDQNHSVFEYLFTYNLNNMRYIFTKKFKEQCAADYDTIIADNNLKLLYDHNIKYDFYKTHPNKLLNYFNYDIVGKKYFINLMMKSFRANKTAGIMRFRTVEDRIIIDREYISSDITISENEIQNKSIFISDEIEPDDIPEKLIDLCIVNFIMNNQRLE